VKLFGLAIAAIHGFLVVGLLALIQAIVQAFRPEWVLPFSIWWGLLFCLPGLAWTVFAAKLERRRF
jgi:hypothetical protein